MKSVQLQHQHQWLLIVRMQFTEDLAISCHITMLPLLLRLMFVIIEFLGREKITI